ncbi:MAG: hypothetical protein JOZ15_04205 [Acidobacteria bacterium]|nr:hypothetical protein [Acidobacteriota bacterium]
MRNAWGFVLCLALAVPAAAFAQSRSAKIDAIAAIAPRPAATCTMSTPIACGQTINDMLDSTDCQLPDGTAVNYYTFSGSNKETITATLTSSDFAPVISLIDPNGSTKNSNLAPSPGTAEIQFTLDSTGTWTLSANNNSSTFQTGNYTINLSCGTSAPGCIPNDTTLCVADGRYSVTATFDAGGGNSGAAHAVALTSDTGYLWFFSDTNVEAVVKVLDGCGLNSRWWVFAGGLTNVAVTLTVTDTKTNTVKTYHNPAGTPFQPIQDTSAFATCP